MLHKFIFGILGTFILNSAFSCSCDTTSFEDAVEWADEIFIGNLISVEALNPNEKYPASQLWKYTFKVTKKWKGSKASEVNIYQHGSSCDAYFDYVYGEHLVYASEYNEGEFMNPANGNLSTSYCMRNVQQHWENSWFNSDVKRLNQLYPDTVKLRNPLVWKLVLTLSIVVVATAILLIWRRRRRKLPTT